MCRATHHLSSMLVWTSLALLLATALSAPRRSHADEQRPWRDGLQCGPNSLYVFLRSHGVAVELADVQRKVTVTYRGASFADLRDASEQFGVPAAVVKTTVPALRSRELPAIALLDGMGTPFGHFVVVLDVDNEEVTVLDTESTVAHRVEMGAFQRAWTGYAMLPQEPTAVSAALMVVKWFSAGCIVGFGLLWCRGLRQQCRPRRGAGPSP